MLTNILNFVILVVVIISPHHLITILIHSSLIRLSHWSMKIHLSKKWKPHIPLRHFNPRWWLCQVLTFLRLVLVSIRKLFKHQRLLITHRYAMKILPSHISHILHSNCTIPLLMHWRSLTFQALVHDVIYLSFFHFPSCPSQESTYDSKLHVVSHNTMINPWTVLIYMHSLISCGHFETWSVVVFIVMLFLFSGSHHWVIHGPNLHQHGSTSVPVATLEVSLHVIRPMYH